MGVSFLLVLRVCASVACTVLMLRPEKRSTLPRVRRFTGPVQVSYSLELIDKRIEKSLRI